SLAFGDRRETQPFSRGKNEIETFRRERARGSLRLRPRLELRDVGPAKKNRLPPLRRQKAVAPEGDAQTCAPPKAPIRSAQQARDDRADCDAQRTASRQRLN